MKILLAGDSTVADYPLSQAPMMGWGQALKGLCSELEVINYAKCGATTASFVSEGQWASLLKAVAPEVVVLIQFGHNDQKSENGVTANDFYRNLTEMVAQVKQRGGRPVLCTPIERRQLIQGEWFKSLQRESLIIKNVGNETETRVFDLNSYSFLLYQLTEPKVVETYFLHMGTHPHYPMGLSDDTHLSELGAEKIARYVANRLTELSAANLFDSYYYGACMYPEVIDRETLQTDIKHMKKIGMNLARIGEFVWGQLEPTEGTYDVRFLEETLSLYRDNQIDVILCIPTPTPPRWLTRDYPECCLKNSDGTVMTHGSRQHVCTNHPYFRQKAYELTKVIAKVAEEYDNVVAIQLDNEFKCHVDLCYCKACEKGWHQWLEDNYHHIDALNKAWGTAIWSESYGSFQDVVLPTTTPFLHNASLMTAFRKYTADSLNEFAHGLCHVIRQETFKPITHNTALGFNLANQALFSELDVAAFDTYAPASNYPGYTLNLDLWRNLKQVPEMLLLETSTSHAGHIENYIEPHPPKYLQTEIFTGFAAGLKAFTYWHFRGHRYGVEQPHSTVVTAWGEPDLGYEDVVAGGQLLQELRPLLADTEVVKSKIGLIYSDRAKRFYHTETGGFYDYRELITDYYSALSHQGLSVEVIQEETNFSAFEVILVPYVRYLSAKLAAALRHFTEQGGKLILGPMTGDRTKEHALVEGGISLADWLGLATVTQFSCNQPLTANYEGESMELWGLITSFASTDQSVSQITSELAKGKSVLAKKQIGLGEGLYVGAQPKQLVGNQSWQTFIQKELAPFDNKQDFLTISEGIVCYCRDNPERRDFYLANMTGHPCGYQLKQTGQDLLNLVTLSGKQSLEPYGMLVLSFKK